MNYISTIIGAMVQLVTELKNEYMETAEISESQKEAINVFFDYIINRLRGME